MQKLKSMTEEKDEQEYGYEGDMAMNQLSTLIRCAEMIKDTLKPDTDLPEWVQSKITLASDYIVTAADYLHSELEEGYYEKPASAYRRKGDEIGGGSHAPVAPVPDRKYIKGTPEHKAYKATKKPINGMPTNVKESFDADGNIISPISQVMGNFYWQIYKPATTTISLAQLNEFVENQPDSWIRANRADIREFLKRYFIQGQSGASQSGYGDIMNSVWAESKKSKETIKEQKSEVKTEVKTESTNTDRILLFVALGIVGFSLLATLIVFLLPARV
jgi:hypothetical protein